MSLATNGVNTASAEHTSLFKGKRLAKSALPATAVLEMATKWRNALWALSAWRGLIIVKIAQEVNTSLKQVSLSVTIVPLAISAITHTNLHRNAEWALTQMKLTPYHVSFAITELFSCSKVRPNAWPVLLAIIAMIQKAALHLVRREPMLSTRTDILDVTLAPSALV